MYRLAASLVAASPADRCVLAHRGRAGENSGLFEHPASPVEASHSRQVLVVKTRATYGSESWACEATPVVDSSIGAPLS